MLAIGDPCAFDGNAIGRSDRSLTVKGLSRAVLETSRTRAERGRAQPSRWYFVLQVTVRRRCTWL